jgi:hypothetical protein
MIAQFLIEQGYSSLPGAPLPGPFWEKIVQKQRKASFLEQKGGQNWKEQRNNYCGNGN